MTNPAVTHLECTICATHYAPLRAGTRVIHAEKRARSTSVRLRGSSARRSRRSHWRDSDTTMFRYRALLPIGARRHSPATDSRRHTAVPGSTPRRTARCAVALDQGRRPEPTASMKDRASAIAVMKAQEEGAEVITTASTGNAAAALAGIAASVDQRSVIFVPESRLRPRWPSSLHSAPRSSLSTATTTTPSSCTTAAGQMGLVQPQHRR